MFKYGQRNDTVLHTVKQAEGFTVQHYIEGNGPYKGLPPRLY